MINASQEFLHAMTSPVLEQYVRLELLDKDERHLGYIEQKVGSGSNGDISVDCKRDIRRMFTLTLDNSEGEFTWKEGGLIWIDNKFVKLHIGLKTPSGIEYVPQGVFVITQPEAKHKVGDNSVTINGQDKWYLLTGNFGRFTHETTVKKGTKIRDAIMILARGAGIKDDRMLFENTNYTLPYDHTYQIGQNRGQAMKELAQKCFTDDGREFEIFFDVNGYLRFQPVKDPLIEAPVWSYKIEDGTLYAGSARKLDDTELFNHVLVMGGTSNTAEFRSEIVVSEGTTVGENKLTNTDFNKVSANGMPEDWAYWGTPDSNKTISVVNTPLGNGVRIVKNDELATFGFAQQFPLKGIKAGQKVYLSYLYTGDLPNYNYYMYSKNPNMSISDLQIVRSLTFTTGWNLVTCEVTVGVSDDIGVLIGYRNGIKASGTVVGIYMSAVKPQHPYIGHPYCTQAIGNRFFVWNNGNPDPIIDTQSQCDARANFEIKKNLQYTEKVMLDLAPNYLHEANDIVEIVDEKNGSHGNYQLKSFSIPIKPKLVTAEALKIRSVM